MGREYGPWVRHDWCPRCADSTEQTHWYRRAFGDPVDRDERRGRCNDCGSEMTLAVLDAG